MLAPAIVRQTRLALEAGLAALAEAAAGRLRLPRQLVVHRHRGSLDLPRDPHQGPLACFDPRRERRDWQPLRAGDPLFEAADGRRWAYEPPPGLEGETVWPVFLNEAAYGEKGIALSLTTREGWEAEAGWGEALRDLAAGLERQTA